ncbi:Uncharacterized conserved protein YlxW, UPF0749 family [Klenkia soli]|uniref:Uncharacterized conserved protein YlxW, UPF0749 family n=1 Tax=Klenkia soli TaxID=1052260 RepID=A0A1H0GLM2_9ACTN|nr:DUF881 domain-containing protein [Klenkia soli]SDO07778.1 Uncharacterized conserved protein YlxW, UPF0749 family [Klenkia soli]
MADDTPTAREDTPADEPAATTPAETAAAETPAAETPAADTPPTAGTTPAEPAPSVWHLIRHGRRDRLAAALIGVLTLLLGFAFAVQVRSTDSDQTYTGAREEDLVTILDNLNARENRLRQQIAEQRTALEQLSDTDSQAAAALAEAQQRATELGILNGSLAAQGQGLTMTITDPEGKVSAAILLNTIQELRGAGAETMQVDDVRIGVSSAVTGSDGALSIDGQGITAPYVVVVIGDPQVLATAMDIPGGVSATVRRVGGDVRIVQSDEVVVDALRPLDDPQYAEPDGN